MTGAPLPSFDGDEKTSQDGNSVGTTSGAPLPNGVVLGPDGKPCRTCTSGAAWKSMMKQTTSGSNSTSPFASMTTNKSSTASQQRAPMTIGTSDCPPDVEQLGRSTWTFLHTLAANYPERPNPTQQTETRQFMHLFSKVYPCWVCADDFRTWMSTSGNAPRVSNRDEFGQWLCEAHNAVNVKLGKKSFDCSRWEERWRTGWKDGRCD
ncbi:putative FAD dependent sulfhydryl oxidase Erv1 [Dissoconium aciculare CBS 342.82]|uniref:Sulfhydryl oxidase n=1 Tax=Dissoconium aciculare CBS 342.82 TaxID=1314786 RepID=A0A6J3LY77_9PEZI|nr:putative FAD dependent sulfhydryl oxidase Erv1 [Dissoconium aciculare CBS 342.82]KAF1820608.1 putative FAD dependent sulfhydryl oxidase Erv1 [Dissoconium aciculare CBS 342.82]